MRRVIFGISCFLIVITVYQVCYGLKTILPENVSWLMTIMHDWGTHYLGWLFYRNEPWQFPVGDMHRYFYPVGTNIGLTDSIPLMGIFFKLFSSILPADFQYFGIWLFTCHLLVAYYTVKLFRLFNVNLLITFLAVVFIVANPVLIYRGMHPALCAHWLLIASVYYYFLDPSVVKPSKILLNQFILLVLSALINPYLCFMVFGFSFITAIKICFFQKAITRKVWVGYILISCLSLLVCWYMIGMMKPGDHEDLAVKGGYGLYGLNLNSFFNSFGFSTIFPKLKWVSPHQYEGFMYLGAGVFFLLVVLIAYGIFLLVKKIRKRSGLVTRLSFNNTTLVPLLALIILFTLFSITHVVSLNDKVLFTIPLPKILIRFGEVFRASARFFWPVYYLLLFFIIIAISKFPIRNNFKIGILSVALLLQLYDLKLIFTYRQLSYGAYEPPIDNKNWNALLTHFDKIIFYPPFETTNLSFMDYQYFCYLAAKAKKPVNTGYVARLANENMIRYKDSLLNDMQEGNLDTGSLYITTAEDLDYFSYPIQTGACTVNYLDGYYYLFSNDKTDNKLRQLAGQLNSAHEQAIDSAINSTGNKIEFEKANDTLLMTAGNVHHFIERFSEKETSLSLTGWAFDEAADNNKGDSVFILLKNDRAVYSSKTIVQPRKDVTDHFKKSYLDDAGYDALIFTDNVEKGTYRVGVAVKKKNGQMIYTLTDRNISVGLSEYAQVEKMNTLPDSGDVKYNAETITENDKSINISGWAYLKNQDATGNQIAVVLKNETAIYLAWTKMIVRTDVTTYFHDHHNLDQSGFTVKLLRTSLPTGYYQLGILIRENASRQQKIIFTDKHIKQ